MKQSIFYKKKTLKRAKHKPVRPDLMANGTYNRRVLRNSLRAWAERKGYHHPSKYVSNKWNDWRASELMDKFREQMEADGLLQGNGQKATIG